MLAFGAGAAAILALLAQPKTPYGTTLRLTCCCIFSSTLTVPPELEAAWPSVGAVGGGCGAVGAKGGGTGGGAMGPPASGAVLPAGVATGC